MKKGLLLLLAALMLAAMLTACAATQPYDGYSNVSTTRNGYVNGTNGYSGMYNGTYAPGYNGYTGYNGRTDRKSTGLGLYLCRRTADKLGHTLRVSSEVGKGTLAEIDLTPESIEIE